MITEAKTQEIFNYYAQKAGIPLSNFRIFYTNAGSYHASCTTAFASYSMKEFRPEKSLFSFHVSRKYMKVATMEQFHNTVAHEFGHALTDPRKGGHSAEWRKNAIMLGSDGKRCGALSAEQREQIRKWKGVCPSCGSKVYRDRLTDRVRRGMACGKCCNGVFQREFVYQWFQLR